MQRPYITEPHPLVRKLESSVDLTSEERDALRALPMTVRELGPDQDIVREGDRPSQCCLVLDGFTFRYKIVETERQILAIHIPGQIPDLQSLYLKTLDHSIAALSNARVGFIQHRALYDLVARFPSITGALWRETLIDGAIFREWMAGLGRRKAPSRMAHFFCEMYTLLDAIGLAEGWTVSLPMSQAELGDTLGLSTVHVNRSLQDLRLRGLIDFEKGRLVIHDWDALVEFSGFDPTYLHLKPTAQAPST